MIRPSNSDRDLIWPSRAASAVVGGPPSAARGWAGAWRIGMSGSKTRGVPDSSSPPAALVPGFVRAGRGTGVTMRASEFAISSGQRVRKAARTSRIAGRDSVASVVVASASAFRGRRSAGLVGAGSGDRSGAPVSSSCLRAEGRTTFGEDRGLGGPRRSITVSERKACVGRGYGGHALGEEHVTRRRETRRQDGRCSIETALGVCSPPSTTISPWRGRSEQGWQAEDARDRMCLDRGGPCPVARLHELARA